MNNHMHDHEYVIHCLLPLLPTLFLRSFLRPNFGAFGASHFTSGCQQLAILATLDTNSWCRPRSCSKCQEGASVSSYGKAISNTTQQNIIDAVSTWAKTTTTTIYEYHPHPSTFSSSVAPQPDSRPSLFHPGAPAPDLQLWPSVTGVLSPGWPASWRWRQGGPSFRHQWSAHPPMEKCPGWIKPQGLPPKIGQA